MKNIRTNFQVSFRHKIINNNNNYVSKRHKHQRQNKIVCTGLVGAARSVVPASIAVHI
jgi:hypothetical protein